MNKRYKYIGYLFLVSILLCFSFSSVVFAEGRGSKGIPSPFTSYGAETYSALNLFKAVFPDTHPGEEEWYLNINWTADPLHGYLSMPLSLPGYGKYTSEKLDTFMQRAGVPVKDGQYTLYGLGDTLVGVYAKGEKGKGSWALRPPTDDYIQTMANLTSAEIAGLAERGIWQINPRREIPEMGPDASPGWLTQYYFLPPDLQVKDLKTTYPDARGRATATATFLNNCNFGGATKIYLYRVNKDGSKEMLKEQEVYIGPFKTATLQAEYVASNTKGVAASIARPWTGTEWGYGHFKAENGIYELDGYAVETGSGAYPPELLGRLKSNWNNNVKEAGVNAGVDVAVAATPGRSSYTLYEGSAKCVVNVEVFRKDSGPTVDVKVTASGPLGTQTKTLPVPSGLTRRTAFTFTAYKPGSYKITVQAWPVGVTDVNTSNNTDVCTVVVKEPDPVDKDTGMRHELSGR